MAEATANTVLGKISQGHLECPICCCRFKDPKMLDCLHSFCLNCLEELVNREQLQVAKIVCPVCRRETAVPDTGLQDLVTCFFLSSLVDEFDKQERLLGDASMPSLKCDQCEEGMEAVARCLECDGNICQKCQEAHGHLKTTKKHRIVTIESLSQKGFTLMEVKKADREAPKCGKHINHELCLYCFTCKVLMCAKCAAFDHRGAEHNYSEIADVMASFREDVDEVLQKFEKSKKEFIVAKVATEHAKSHLKIMVARACKDISAKKEEEIAKIRDKSRVLREKVTQIGNNRAEKYDEVLGTNCDKINKAEQMVAAVKDLMGQADDFKLQDLKVKIMHNLEFQEKLQIEPTQHGLSFVAVKCQSVVNDRDIGEIHHEEKWELKEEFDVEGEDLEDGEDEEEYGEFNYFSNIGCFSGGEIALTDIGIKRLILLSSTGVYKQAYVQGEEGQLKSPSGVAVTQDDQLVTTDGTQVKVLDSNLQLIRQFTPVDTDENSESFLTCVAVDKQNRIAVADKGRKVISLHNLDGRLITSVHNEMTGNYLAISSKERLILSNFEKKRLLCLDFTGEEVFNVGTSVRTNGKAVTPRGVCCDDAGDIYLVTSRRGLFSGEVHHYDPEGAYIGRVAHGLFDPLDLTFTPSGDLAVADRCSVKILHRI